MSYPPIIINAGQLQQLPSGEALKVGNVTIDAAQITSDTGSISFGSAHLSTTGSLLVDNVSTWGDRVENVTNSLMLLGTPNIVLSATAVTTTATLSAGVTTIDSDITIGSGSITSVSGAISFVNENLSTTGTVVGSNIPSPTVTDKVLTSTGAGTAIWADPTGGSDYGDPTADNQLLQATGASAASWTKVIEGLTSVAVNVNTALNPLHVVGPTGGADTDFIALFAQTGITPEGSIAPDAGGAHKGVAVMGDGGAYYIARDVTNNIQGTFGTSTSGVIFFGAMTAHGLDLRTDNVQRMLIKETTGYVQMNTNNQLFQMGSAQNYSFTWNGNNAVHTIASGGFHVQGGTTHVDTLISNTTMTIASGSITDTTGAISFGNENLSTTGNMGIGATASSENLYVYEASGNSIVLVKSASDDARFHLDAPADEQDVIAFLSAGNSRTSLYRPENSDDLRLYDYGVGNDKVTFRYGTPDVGINTNAPDVNLEINDATGGELRLTYNDSSGSAANHADLKTNSNGGLDITTTDGDGAVGHITLVPDGNVLVGTVISTGAKLEVDGSISSTGTITAASLTSTGGTKHYAGDDAYAYNNPHANRTTGNPITGTCVIDFPFDSFNGFMAIKIRGYTYTATSAWEALIGGYPYSSGVDRWYNHRASVSGEVPFTKIRLGYNGNTGKVCIMFGETDTDWHYPVTQIVDFVTATGTTDGFETGWDISFYTDETNFYNNDADHRDPETLEWNRDYPAPASVGQVLQCTSDKVASWTTSLTGLTSVAASGQITGSNIATPTGAKELSYSTGVGTWAWAAPGNDKVITTNSSGFVDFAAKSFGFDIPDPANAGEVYQATGAGAASWSRNVTGLTQLVVDSITIDAASISSDAGYITFDDDQLSTAGRMAVGSHALEDYTQLDVQGAYSTGKYANQLHLHTSNNTYGMFMGSWTANVGYISQGAYYNSSGQFMARTANIAIQGMYDGEFIYYVDKGETSGVAYTPTEMVRINEEGLTTSGAFIGTQGNDTNQVFHDVYSYKGPNGTSTGTMKIALPNSWMNTMITFKIRGYNYGSKPGPWEVSVGGYSNSGGYWTYYSAIKLGTFCPFDSVRLAHDGTNCCVLLGTTSTAWSYPQVSVVEVVAGYANQTGYATGWSASILASEAGISAIVTCRVATPPRQVFGDETIFVTTAGNDTSGNGDNLNPFATPERAIEELGRMTIGNNAITVDIGPGVYTRTTPLEFKHPFGGQVTFLGDYEKITGESTTSIGSTEYNLSTVSGNLDYVIATITFPGSTNLAADDYILISNASGGSNPQALQGCHKVESYAADVATIHIIYRAGVAKPSGTISFDCMLVRTVLDFSMSNGFKADGPYHMGMWEGVVIQGDENHASCDYGIWMLNSPTISLKEDGAGYGTVGIRGWQRGVYAQNNAMALF